MVVNRKGPLYPLEGHQCGEQKNALESSIGTLRWLTERYTGTLWRGTMVVNRKRPLYTLKGNHGSEQKETLEPTAGAPWW